MPLLPDEKFEPTYTPTHILRNNPGMIRDCYWDGEYFVVRQIMADPKTGTDGMSIKAFRFSPEETNILREILVANAETKR